MAFYGDNSHHEDLWNLKDTNNTTLKVQCITISCLLLGSRKMGHMGRGNQR